jgi:hypothetical protein
MILYKIRIIYNFYPPPSASLRSLAKPPSSLHRLFTRHGQGQEGALPAHSPPLWRKDGELDRSAFKLLQIDQEFSIFHGIRSTHPLVCFSARVGNHSSFCE